MQISTKFDIAQTVWFIHDNKPEQAVIRSLRVFCTEKPAVQYDLQGRPGFYPEFSLFPSKAALLESL